MAVCPLATTSQSDRPTTTSQSAAQPSLSYSTWSKQFLSEWRSKLQPQLGTGTLDFWAFSSPCSRFIWSLCLEVIYHDQAMRAEKKGALDKSTVLYDPLPHCPGLHSLSSRRLPETWT